MKIKQNVLDRIKQDAALKRELAYKLRVSEQAIARYLKTNNPNGELTKILAVGIISSGLNEEQSEILEGNE